MIKVVPYIETIGTEKFKKFLSSPFSFDLLNSNNENCIFEGWEKTDFHIYVSPNGDTLNCENGVDYSINKNTMLPYPTTINDFINDMVRMNIDLYWSETILLTFEPKDMYSAEKIRQYYVDLLEKMDKGYELL